MNKKGVSGSLEIIIAMVVLIVSIGVILLFYYRANLSNASNSQVCHDSVVLKATGKGLGTFNCKTDYVCISGGGKCANMNPTVTINVDPSNKEEIMKAISDQLAQCWWTYGEGKLDYQGINSVTSGPYAFRADKVCAVCSIVGFDDTIQNALSPGSVLASSSQFTSLTAWFDNYAKYSDLFDKYSSGQYLPKGVSQNYFKALLVGIAQENNWGTDSQGSWLMGYRANDKDYQDAETQIKDVAQIFQKAFDKDTGSGLEDQSGDVVKDYARCKYSQFDWQAACMLSVYHTGKTNTGRFANTFMPFGWFHNTEGDKYASSVLFYWKVLKDYFGQQAAEASGASTGGSSSQTEPLTYKDLINYLSVNTVVEDGQKQPYLSFLYGVSSLADFVQGQSLVSQFYNSESIPLNGQYAIITGEGKQLKFGGNILDLYSFGPHVYPNFFPPVIVSTNKVSKYFSSACGDNFITSA